MIAFKYFVALAFLGFALGQEGSGVEDVAPVGRSCYVGTGNFTGAIETKQNECKFLENSCQAKVEVGPSGMRVYGECKELVACESNAAGKDCYSMLLSKAQAAKMDHVCHYCCQGNLCNTGFFAEAGLDESRNRLLFK